MANMGTSADPPVLDVYPSGSLEPKVYSGTLKLGIELSLGRDLDHTLPGRVAIAKFAYSSTSLNTNWAVNGTYPTAQPNLCTQFIAYIKAAERATGSRLAAIIWIQGENDAGNLTTANNYDDNLLAFVDAVRAGTSTVPFIYGRLHISAAYSNVTELRASQSNANGARANLIMMSQDTVALSGDSVHYDANGLIALGHIYANQVLATLGINQLPYASFTYVEAGLQVTFTGTSTDTDGTIASRLWEFGDGATSTAANPVHTYAADGTYTVTLTVTDDDGGVHRTEQILELDGVNWTVDGGVAIPANATEFQALIDAAGLNGVFFVPDSGYLCQELAAPTLADSFGAFNLTAVGTGQAYQVPITGMTGKGVSLSDGTTGSWSTTSASLPDMATGSSMVLAIVEMPAVVPGATRNIVQLGTTAIAAARYHSSTGPKLGALSGANSLTGAANPASRVMPIWLSVDRNAGDGDGSDQAVLTDQETITPTFGATIAGKAFRIGSNGAAASVKYRAVYRWDNRTATIAQLKTLSSTAGWTMA